MSVPEPELPTQASESNIETSTFPEFPELIQNAEREDITPPAVTMPESMLPDVDLEVDPELPPSEQIPDIEEIEDVPEPPPLPEDILAETTAEEI